MEMLGVGIACLVVACGAGGAWCGWCVVVRVVRGAGGGWWCGWCVVRGALDHYSVGLVHTVVIIVVSCKSCALYRACHFCET
jgi:hypothetical protein